ncbi:MAG: hypothetical protein H6620_09920 [Halobacteriovoraceae bacterium]|nr:hypothetical protein [Halobacteriovoraceae bacterium]
MKEMEKSGYQFDNQNFKLEEHYVKKFQKHGFVKIKGFLNSDAIAFLKNRTNNEMTNVHFKELTSRIKYELQNEKQKMCELVTSRAFRTLLLGITGKELFFAFDLALELEKNKSKGFPWHVGVQSFAVQMLEDFGCTIWVPLDRISVEEQAGGIACVSKTVLSGEFIYEKIEPALISTLENKEKHGIKTTLDDYYFLRQGVLNSPALTEILEYHKIEEDYEVGDVLLFDKNVIHRSSMLKEGPLEKRAAIAIRFMDVSSRFNKKQALNIDYPAKKYGAKLSSQIQNQIKLAHGESFLNSKYFDNLDKRVLKSIP